MIKTGHILLFFFLLVYSIPVGAQTKTSKITSDSLIQFSGIVIERDSLKPVSFTKIMIVNTKRGTTSDFYGYFSFVAKVNDTIEFSAAGFKKVKFVIPDSLTTNRYSLIQVMTMDTIILKETVIYP